MRFAVKPTTGAAVGPGTWTTEGVRRRPSESAMTNGIPESTVATNELVVPRSIPTILLMNKDQDFNRLPANNNSPGGSDTTRSGFGGSTRIRLIGLASSCLGG